MANLSINNIQIWSFESYFFWSKCCFLSYEVVKVFFVIQLVAITFTQRHQSVPDPPTSTIKKLSLALYYFTANEFFNIPLHSLIFLYTLLEDIWQIFDLFRDFLFCNMLDTINIWPKYTFTTLKPNTCLCIIFMLFFITEDTYFLVLLFLIIFLNFSSDLSISFELFCKKKCSFKFRMIPCEEFVIYFTYFEWFGVALDFTGWLWTSCEFAIFSKRKLKLHSIALVLKLHLCSVFICFIDSSGVCTIWW